MLVDKHLFKQTSTCWSPISTEESQKNWVQFGPLFGPGAGPQINPKGSIFHPSGRNRFFQAPSLNYREPVSVLKRSDSSQTEVGAGPHWGIIFAPSARKLFFRQPPSLAMQPTSVLNKPGSSKKGVGAGSHWRLLFAIRLASRFFQDPPISHWKPASVLNQPGSSKKGCQCRISLEVAFRHSVGKPIFPGHIH